MPENPQVSSSGTPKQSGTRAVAQAPCQFSPCGEPIEYTPNPRGGRPPSYHQDKTWEPGGRTCAQLGQEEQRLQRVYAAAGLTGARRLDLAELAAHLDRLDTEALDPLRDLAELVHALDGQVGRARTDLATEVHDAHTREEAAHAAAAAADQRARDADAEREAMRVKHDAMRDEYDAMRAERDVDRQARAAAEDLTRQALAARDAAVARAEEEKTKRADADREAETARITLATRDTELNAERATSAQLRTELETERRDRADERARLLTEHTAAINDLHAKATAARDELRTQLTADHEARLRAREDEHGAQLAERDQQQTEALNRLRAELTAETERQLAQAAALHEQQRAALAAQLEDLTGRAARAEATAVRERADRDRYAEELHTLREDLMLQLAQGPDAAPLAGRIAAALGAGARRMARDTDIEPDVDGESR